MLDGVKEGFQGAWEILQEKANFVKKGSNKVIDSWLDILPLMEEYHLEINSFAMNYSINPSLEVELKGLSKDFTIEKVQQYITEVKSPLVKSVFQAVKTTVALHARTKSVMKEDLIIEIRVSISPEIKVFLGIPVIE